MKRSIFTVGALAFALMSSTALMTPANALNTINAPHLLQTQTVFPDDYIKADPALQGKLDTSGMGEAITTAVAKHTKAVKPFEIIVQTPDEPGTWTNNPRTFHPNPNAPWTLDRIANSIVAAWQQDPKATYHLPNNFALLVLTHDAQAVGAPASFHGAMRFGNAIAPYAPADKVQAIVAANEKSYARELARGDISGFSVAVEGAVAKLVQANIDAANGGGMGLIGWGIVILLLVGAAWLAIRVFGGGNRAPVTPARTFTPTPTPTPNRERSFGGSRPGPAPASPPANPEKVAAFRRLNWMTDEVNERSVGGFYAKTLSNGRVVAYPGSMIGTPSGRLAATHLANARREYYVGNYGLMHSHLNQLASTLNDVDQFMWYTTYNYYYTLNDADAIAFALSVGFQRDMELALFASTVQVDVVDYSVVPVGAGIDVVEPSVDVVGTDPGAFAGVDIVAPTGVDVVSGTPADVQFDDQARGQVVEPANTPAADVQFDDQPRGQVVEPTATPAADVQFDDQPRGQVVEPAATPAADVQFDDAPKGRVEREPDPAPYVAPAPREPDPAPYVAPAPREPDPAPYVAPAAPTYSAPEPTYSAPDPSPAADVSFDN